MTIPKAAHKSTEAGRWYWKDGEKYVSVTTVLKSLPGKLGPLMAWSKRVVAAEAAAKIHDSVQLERLRGMTQEEVADELRRGPDAIRDAAGVRGSLVHNAIQALVANHSLPPMTNGEKRYVEAARSFLQDFEVEWVHQEVTVFSEELGYAGTCDGIIRSRRLAQLAKLPEDSLFTLDWKTGAVYPEAAVQLAAYAAADTMDVGGQYIPMPREGVMGGVIVQLDSSGEYDVFYTDFPERAMRYFRLALEIAGWEEEHKGLLTKYNRRYGRFGR